MLLNTVYDYILHMGYIKDSRLKVSIKSIYTSMTGLMYKAQKTMKVQNTDVHRHNL